MSKETQAFDIFDAFNERIIAYNVVYVRVTGSITAAVLLSQLVYWARTKRYEEFYKTDREIMEETGAAWKKMQEIIKAQGGNPDIEPNQIVLGAHKYYINATHGGKITFTDNKGINTICRILGAPANKLAGIYLNKQYGEHVKKGERLFTLYADNNERIALAREALKKITIFKIK
jgi:AMP phosphorylase